MHPPLRHLSFNIPRNIPRGSPPCLLEGEVFDEVLKLLRLRPSLSVFRSGSGTSHPDFVEAHSF